MIIPLELAQVQLPGQSPCVAFFLLCQLYGGGGCKKDKRLNDFFMFAFEVEDVSFLSFPFHFQLEVGVGGGGGIKIAPASGFVCFDAGLFRCRGGGKYLTVMGVF